MWFNLHPQETTVCGMDDQIHLRFIDSDPTFPGNLATGTKAVEGFLDVIGRSAAMKEVVLDDPVAQDQAGTV